MDLGVSELTRSSCTSLGPLIRAADVIDCAAHDYDPVEALFSGLSEGPSWLVTNQGMPIGAVGWTYAGAIWSLWRDLSIVESLALLKATPAAVRFIAAQAQRPLGNVVWEGNVVTRAWLAASGCFEFLDSAFQHHDKVYLPFHVKPFGDLPNV
jgi:hypothetical protein